MLARSSLAQLTRIASVVAALLCLALAAPAEELALGEVTVKGDTLRGRVADFTTDGLHFQPVHGKGTIVIPWADVESVRSEIEFAVMHGDEGESHGRIVGIEDGGKVILIGDDPATAERIETASLFRSFPDDEFGDSFMERMRSRFRYWSGNLDAGAAYVDSSTDTLNTNIATRIERRKGPNRAWFDGTFRYNTEKEQGEDRSTIENVLIGFARAEHDVTDRLFAYASTRATYDEDQNISLRLEPRGGGGFRIFREEDYEWSADVGTAWIYEDFFGSTAVLDAGGNPVFIGPPGNRQPVTDSRGRQNFWTVAFGTDVMAKLPLGAIWRADAEYLPAVDAWNDDYIIRARSSIEFPLLEWLALKGTVFNEYDNTPADDAERNRLAITGALSFRF